MSVNVDFVPAEVSVPSSKPLVRSLEHQGDPERPSSSHRPAMHESFTPVPEPINPIPAPLSQPVRRLLNRPNSSSQMNQLSPIAAVTTIIDSETKAGTRRFTPPGDPRADKDISPRLGRRSLLEANGDTRPDNSSRESLNPRMKKRYSATITSPPHQSHPSAPFRSSPRHKTLAAPGDHESVLNPSHAIVNSLPGEQVTSFSGQAQPMDTALHPPRLDQRVNKNQPFDNAESGGFESRRSHPTVKVADMTTRAPLANDHVPEPSHGPPPSRPVTPPQTVGHSALPLTGPPSNSRKSAHDPAVQEGTSNVPVSSSREDIHRVVSDNIASPSPALSANPAYVRSNNPVRFVTFHLG
jgi:hypothetical protein